MAEITTPPNPEVNPDQVTTAPVQETPEGTGKPVEGTIEVEGKKYVPLEKFSASAVESIRLAQENEKLKKPTPTVVPEDEKKTREIIAKTAQEKEEQEKLDDQQLRTDLEGLHTIYGDFDEKKLLSIVDRYGVIGDDGKVNYYAAMELYEKVEKVPEEAPKPKVPQGKREAAAPQATVEAPVDVSKKSLPELVREGLGKFGL